MSDLDTFLMNLGLQDPANRQDIKQQIMSLAFELAVSRLLEKGAFSEAEKAQLKQVFDTNTLDEAVLASLFASPGREQVLQAALVEALQLTAEAARQPAQEEAK
jgi:hypothetical protein